MWLAESRAQRLVRLECGFTRDELIGELIERARRDPSLVVGLDFAFSFPTWFLRELGVTSARELWEMVGREGESWLGDCPPPFWGKPFHKRPPFLREERPWRVTERERPP